MAAGTAADFKIYPEQFFGGMYESLQQNTAAFNAASQNALTLVTTKKKGHYEAEAFMQRLTNLVTRRDITSVADVTDAKLTMGEKVAIKINRSIGPVADTMDAWKKIGRDPNEFSFALGKMTGDEVLLDMVNTAILAVVAATKGVTAMNVDGSAGTLTHGMIADGLQTFGDKSQNVVCLLFHSKVQTDLLKQSITDKIFGVANLAVYNGAVGTLNRPFIVLDSPSLFEAGTPNIYRTVGLVRNAVEVTESEDRTIISEPVTGKANLLMRVQGEYAFNLGLKGYTYDVTNGGVNPTDAAVGTSSNWDKVASDNKSLAAFTIKTQ